MSLPFPPPLLAALDDVFIGTFGITAAALLVGGSVLLRWQRNRQQFQLVQAALQQGIQPHSAGSLWLASLKQGLTTLTLGVGLLVVGLAAYALAARVDAPTELPQPARTPTVAPRDDRPPPPPGADWPPDRRLPPDRQPGDRQGPDRQNPDRQIPGQPRVGGGGDGFDNPPPATPQRERWHRAQAQQAIATIAMGCGVILVLLGGVQVAFARLERKYARDSVDPDA